MQTLKFEYMSYRQLTRLDELAIDAGLRKFLASETFYVSTLRELAELIGVKISEADFKPLAVIHCLRWSEMNPELASLTKAKCLQILGVNIVVEDAPEVEHASPQTANPVVSLLKSVVKSK